MKVTKDIKEIKNNLFNIINKIGLKATWFSKKPGTYFTRNRKLNIVTILKFMFFMEENTLNIELLKYFNFKQNIPSSSALIEQRKKIHLDTFKYIFNKFTNTIKCNKTYKGYRLLACDGSNLNYACNNKDTTTYIKHPLKHGKGHNSLHLNVLYDLKNNIYLDTEIQNKKEYNEFKVLTIMVNRLNLPRNTIIIADRGYESYNIFANIENNNYKYLIRVKDIYSNGILSSLSLPDTEFDMIKTLTLTRKQTKEAKRLHNLKFLPSNCTFDFMDKQNPYYIITLRIVRFKLPNGNYECIITNLDENIFKSNEIKELYNMRWGVETSFREIKYDLGLINFHSKTKEFVFQEIYIRLTLYNFCKAIIKQISIKNINNTKYLYEIDGSTAFMLCKQYLKNNNFNAKRLTSLILKYLHPVRLGRSNKRKLQPKGCVSFTYRIAA